MLAIPDNGNASNGLMLSEKTLGGSPLSSAYAEPRMRGEPLIEVTQSKGDGEAHTCRLSLLRGTTIRRPGGKQRR